MFHYEIPEDLRFVVVVWCWLFSVGVDKRPILQPTLNYHAFIGESISIFSSYHIQQRLSRFSH